MTDHPILGDVKIAEYKMSPEIAMMFQRLLEAMELDIQAQYFHQHKTYLPPDAIFSVSANVLHTYADTIIEAFNTPTEKDTIQ